MAAVVIALLSSSSTPAAADDEVHPTLEEFKEEIERADLVFRGQVDGTIEYHGTRPGIKVGIHAIYKGSFDRSTIPVMTSEKCSTGTDVVVLAKRLAPHPKDPMPFGEQQLYSAPFVYPVGEGQLATFAERAGGAAGRSKSGTLDSLIRRIVAQQRRAGSFEDEYVLGEVQFADDFNDGSMAGWTPLTGSRCYAPPEGISRTAPVPPSSRSELWLGENLRWTNAFPSGLSGTVGQLIRDPATQNLEGTCDGVKLELGVYDGRLRLRTSHVHHHIVLLAGDPNWSDYQVDVDTFVHGEQDIKEPALIAEGNYRKFGIFGRVNVPNLPGTTGEHTELAVECGTYANLGAGYLKSNAIQIRLKAPDVGHQRNGSAEARRTKILDYQTYPIRLNTRIHLTAKFMGRRVEGWIDGKKYVEGTIPESNWPQFQRGRIALWTFMTFAEFDNLRVTRLVKKISQ
jgi:hypothetical protein